MTCRSTQQRRVRLARRCVVVGCRLAFSSRPVCLRLLGMAAPCSSGRHRSPSLLIERLARLVAVRGEEGHHPGRFPVQGCGQSRRRHRVRLRSPGDWAKHARRPCDGDGGNADRLNPASVPTASEAQRLLTACLPCCCPWPLPQNRMLPRLRPQMLCVPAQLTCGAEGRSQGLATCTFSAEAALHHGTGARACLQRSLAMPCQ